jgi:hypothetical protein
LYPHQTGLYLNQAVSYRNQTGSYPKRAVLYPLLASKCRDRARYGPAMTPECLETIATDNHRRAKSRVVRVARHREEWIRLPSPGSVCPYSGLKRTQINGLVLPCAANGHKPPVRSVSLRKPGGVKGTRLIHLQSLLDYLAGLEAQQIAAATTAAEKEGQDEAAE